MVSRVLRELHIVSRSLRELHIVSRFARLLHQCVQRTLVCHGLEVLHIVSRSWELHIVSRSGREHCT